MNHIEKIKKEFSKQAENFNEYQKNFTKEDLTKFAIENMKLLGEEKVLEIAAGTCGFGMSVAPYVKHITEFDVTKAMLEVGKKESEKENINNLTFVTGTAENLPFLNNSFQIVMSRLGFHHFENPEIVFSEITNVVTKDGKIVILDMEARDEHLREIADKLETLRDPSHVRCLSKEDFRILGENSSFKMTFCKTIPVAVSLNSWLALTKTPSEISNEIIIAMETEINGGNKTGFEPYIKDEEIYFNHKWMLCIFENIEIK